MDSFQALKEGLVNLLTSFRSLHEIQLFKLLAFICYGRPQDNILNFGLEMLIPQLNEDQVKELVDITNKRNPADYEKFKNESRDPFIRNMTVEHVNAFGSLFRLQMLKEMLHQYLELEHLLRLYDSMPRSYSSLKQKQVLELLQQFLNELTSNRLREMHDYVSRQVASQRSPYEQLLKPEQFLLLPLIKGIFQMQVEQLLSFHQGFTRLFPFQLNLLSQLISLEQPPDILEIRQYLSDDEPWLGLLAYSRHQSDGDTEMEDDILMKDDCGLLLRILVQPPSQTVYKRNLKSDGMFPELILDGDDKYTLLPGETLVVTPSLFRASDNKELSGKLAGAEPLPINFGGRVQFKNLKVLLTSHQCNESLFYVRFELRSMSSSREFKTLSFTNSNPFLAVSHSTLLRTPTSVVPTVMEVVPCYGSPSGGSRVAVIGANFVDSPLSVRVRFDNQDVIPEYHGPGTLICTAPQHMPGVVDVYVSNDGRRFSNTSATFKYEERVGNSMDGNMVPEQYNFQEKLRDNMLFNSGGLTASLENILTASIGGINTTDINGYAPIHYASVQHSTQFLEELLKKGANPKLADKRGNTALHWAAQLGSPAVITYLLRIGLEVNSANAEGWTPLHKAVAANRVVVVALLLRVGAIVDCTTSDGVSPLHLAVCDEGEEGSTITKLLLRYSLNKTPQDDCGDTPLHWAVRENMTTSIRLLKAAGASDSIENQEGETAATLAQTVGHHQVAELLLPSAHDTRSKAQTSQEILSVPVPVSKEFSIDKLQGKGFPQFSPFEIQEGNACQMFAQLAV